MAFWSGFALEVLVETEGFLDLPADGLQGVEGGHGILHDHGDLPAADAAPVLFGLEGGQVDASPLSPSMP